VEIRPEDLRTRKRLLQLLATALAQIPELIAHLVEVGDSLLHIVVDKGGVFAVVAGHRGEHVVLGEVEVTCFGVGLVSEVVQGLFALVQVGLQAGVVVYLKLELVRVGAYGLGILAGLEDEVER